MNALSAKIVGIAALLAMLSVGCDQKNSGESNAAAPSAATPAIAAPSSADDSSVSSSDIIRRLGLPADYFPTAVGTRWVYEVKIFSMEDRPALIHRMTAWPVSDTRVRVVETRGRLWREHHQEGMRLILRVDSRTTHQGSLQYPEGYKIAIDRDDAGIFEDVKNVFWAISTSQRYEVTEVSMYDANSPGSLNSGGPWGSFDERPGQSMRFLLFGEKPDIELSFHDENDALLFVGPEVSSDGVKCLHFQRRVEARKATPDDSSAKADILDKAFTEDIWYGKGMGLYHLAQKVDGVETMTWSLMRE